MILFFTLSSVSFILAVFALVVRAHAKRWRRIYQYFFERGKPKLINRNKSIDEAIPAPAMKVAAICLFCSFILALLGVVLRDSSELPPSAFPQESTAPKFFEGSNHDGFTRRPFREERP